MELNIPLPPLPTAEELPDSDDTAVDNELQNLIPNLLLEILSMIWSERADWYFGVDMGIYYLPTSPRNSLVPDGFLSVGVPRRKNTGGRLSYVLWEENWIPPIFSLEVVSHKYGGEYDLKMSKYADLGVLYYVIYNPQYYQRDQHSPLEVYKLINNQYVLQFGEPFWIPELELGIGITQGIYQGWEREWLYWFDESGNKFVSAEERGKQSEKKLQDLLAKLRERGINPEEL